MSNFHHLRICFSLLFAALALLIPYNGFGGENVAQGVKVIVIDAGHGGSRFPGACYNDIKEKDINLEVALKLGKLIEKSLPGVKVVYTRTTDTVLGNSLSTDLQARADIAHKNNGDLFISIHSNAAGNSSVRGTVTLIMGETAMEQTQNQNSLYRNNQDELLDMSDQKTAAIVRAYIQNLQFTYGEYSEMMARLIQEEYAKLGMRDLGVRRQPLKVLYATDMPSVLTEIGFMSNEQDLAYITSEKGQKEICEAIFRAVKAYVENVQRTLLVDSAPAVETKSTTTTTTKSTATKSTTTTTTTKSAAPKSTPKSTTTTTKSTTPKSTQESAQKSSPTTTTAKRYTIQIMSGPQRVSTSGSQFKVYAGKVWILELQGPSKYKYCVGDFTDRATAQKHLGEVHKYFPQAFILPYEK